MIHGRLSTQSFQAFLACLQVAEARIVTLTERMWQASCARYDAA